MNERIVRRAEFFAAVITAEIELRKSDKTIELADHLRDTSIAFRLDTLPVIRAEHHDCDPLAGLSILAFKDGVAA